ncbi:transcriptional regulator [Lactovum miscens]|uniref:Rgg/GadR/MutR family transcriptional activator n=1 Tax=Lactovum miscens TaxID=190387 RepID=A0A841C7B8_9LACT|nr:transcriptional regulator [Lactovum miscens]MBB5888197.1 Rgg/GadR/MutR family transcriptional activator [Lactovum miscens]
MKENIQMDKKLNLKIGETFALIRKAKGLTLKDVTTGEFSEAQQSKFESGESDITVSKFFVSLKNSNVSLDEFQTIYDNYTASENYSFRRELSQAYVKRDLVKLKSMVKEWEGKSANFPTRKYYKIDEKVVRAILALASGSKIMKEDVLFITDYLDDVQEWGRYELWIFGNCLNFFDNTMLSYYGSYILGRTNFYHTIHLNQQIVIRTLLNIINVWLLRSDLVQAFKYINHLRAMEISSDFFYEKIMLKYHEGHYEYLQGFREKGKKEMQKCADTLEYYGEVDQARNLEKEIEKL